MSEEKELPPLPPKWTGKFRKRPVIVAAVQLTRENASEVWGWASEAFRTGQARDVIIDADDGLTIKTLEGDMRASFGDWVIRGVKGEFYPCAADVFTETYEILPDDDEADRLAEMEADARAGGPNTEFL